jgi:NAD(P)-dependent dehydrogenase (short-subunit alcohol dehydrogenase family)
MQSANLFRVDGLTAFVTGASSGLGVTFAGGLAAAGANVVLAARRTDKLRDVEAKLKRSGANVFSVQCDVTDDAQVESAVAAACERFGRVDILVNNAGQVVDGGAVAENLPHELFRQTLDVNLTGTWYCCREVGRRMLADGRGGSIINISSICGIAGLHDFPVAYQASKAAVINLTRNLALSWADRGVRVNAIAPGWFPSEMSDPVLGQPEFRTWAEQGAAMGRIGNPQELVGPLLFLASDASSYVTGQTLAVDGGTSAGIGVIRPPDIFRRPDEAGQKIGMTTRAVAAD